MITSVAAEPEILLDMYVHCVILAEDFEYPGFAR